MDSISFVFSLYIQNYISTYKTVYNIGAMQIYASLIWPFPELTLVLIHTIHLHDADTPDKAYHNFPNHNVPFFPFAGSRTRGVALITPGNNRSGYATGYGTGPRISRNRGGADAAYR